MYHHMYNEYNKNYTSPYWTNLQQQQQQQQQPKGFYANWNRSYENNLNNFSTQQQQQQQQQINHSYQALYNNNSAVAAGNSQQPNNVDMMNVNSSQNSSNMMAPLAVSTGFSSTNGLHSANQLTPNPAGQAQQQQTPGPGQMNNSSPIKHQQAQINNNYFNHYSNNPISTSNNNLTAAVAAAVAHTNDYSMNPAPPNHVPTGTYGYDMYDAYNHQAQQHHQQQHVQQPQPQPQQQQQQPVMPPPPPPPAYNNTVNYQSYQHQYLPPPPPPPPQLQQPTMTAPHQHFIYPWNKNKSNSSMDTATSNTDSSLSTFDLTNADLRGVAKFNRMFGHSTSIRLTEEALKKIERNKNCLSLLIEGDLIEYVEHESSLEDRDYMRSWAIYMGNSMIMRFDNKRKQILYESYWKIANTNYIFINRELDKRFFTLPIYEILNRARTSKSNAKVMAKSFSSDRNFAMWCRFDINKSDIELCTVDYGRSYSPREAKDMLIKRYFESINKYPANVYEVVGTHPLDLLQQPQAQAPAMNYPSSATSPPVSSSSSHRHSKANSPPVKSINKSQPSITIMQPLNINTMNQSPDIGRRRGSGAISAGLTRTDYAKEFAQNNVRQLTRKSSAIENRYMDTDFYGKLIKSKSKFRKSRLN